MQFRRKADDSNAVWEEILMCLIMSLECNCGLKTFPQGFRLIMSWPTWNRLSLFWKHQPSKFKPCGLSHSSLDSVCQGLHNQNSTQSMTLTKIWWIMASCTAQTCQRCVYVCVRVRLCELCSHKSLPAHPSTPFNFANPAQEFISF